MQSLQSLPPDIIRLLLADPSVFYRLTKTNKAFRQYENDPLVLRLICNAPPSLLEIKRVLSNTRIKKPYRSIQTFGIDLILPEFLSELEPTFFGWNPNYSSAKIYSRAGGPGYYIFDLSSRSLNSFYGPGRRYGDLNTAIDKTYREDNLTYPNLMIAYLVYRERPICNRNEPNYAITKTLQYYDQMVDKWRTSFVRLSEIPLGDFDEFWSNFRDFIDHFLGDLRINNINVVRLLGFESRVKIEAYFTHVQEFRSKLPELLAEFDKKIIKTN